MVTIAGIHIASDLLLQISANNYVDKFLLFFNVLMTNYFIFSFEL